MHIFYVNKPNTRLVSIHMVIPTMVGAIKATKVHLTLPVSFFMVRRVVEQGQWNSENSMVFTAVNMVQPFSTKSSFISARDRVSEIVPWDRYAMTIIGRTVSLAGKPRINARSIVPSSPMALANGSRIADVLLSRVSPPMVMFANIHIISPAGAATAAALPKTNRVLSRIERTITRKKSGFLYGGSSRVKEDGCPFKIVLDKMVDTRKVTKIPSITKPVKISVDKSDENLLPLKIINIVIREIRVGNLPLQGTKQLVRIAISRSRGESIILQPVTPTALQPNPIHMVSACFP